MVAFGLDFNVKEKKHQNQKEKKNQSFEKCANEEVEPAFQRSMNS